MPYPSALQPTMVARRRALLQGVSLGALLLASPPAHAGAPFPSINQALARAGRGAQASASASAGVTAARQAQLGAQNLAAAAARFAALARTLGAAHAQVAGSGVNGLAPGGLQVLAGGQYTGAAAPTQAPGTYNVTIKQTQALAQLAWQTFNVGPKTHLTFDQSAGGSQASSWVAINSVRDPLQSPTQILGAISAPGKIYILNRNGIAFGTGSTVNVGALVAATADIAQSQFGSDATGMPTFSLYGAQNAAGYVPTFVNGVAASAITVAPGAVIATPAATGTARGGSVFLFGGSVDNQGSIATPQGQTVLAAGTEFTLRQGSQGSTTAGNTISTTLGSEVGSLNTPVGGVFTGGTVANEGIVVADQGDISLVGHSIVQSGALLSTTTVNTRGTIHLLTPTDPADAATATASVTLAPGSVTEILPEDDGTTALDSQRAADVASSATLNAQRLALGGPSATNPELNDQSLLADQLGESRIEISTGGTVDVQKNALAVTPGGQVAIGAAGRVLLEGGSTIDVSGSTSAVLPASVNDLLVNVQPYQLRDSAANRTGGLKSTNVHIDARTLVEIASGAYGPTAANPLGNIYTPGGLFEVGGYLGLVPHGIGEWTAIGGQVILQSQQTAGTLGHAGIGGEVIAAPGSVINLTGGTVSYASGAVRQSYVRAEDGTIYNANTAPGNLVYSGVYTGQVFAEPRWRVTDTYNNPLLTPGSVIDPAYVVGRDAGSLTVSAATVLMQGSVPAGVTLGQAQTGARPAVVSDPYLLAQSVVPLAGSLAIGDYATGSLLAGYDTAIRLASPETLPPAPMGIAGPLAPGIANTAQIDAPMLDADGFARIAMTTTGAIAVAAPVTVADGGSVALAGSTIGVSAPIAARGGAITLSNFLPSTGTLLASPGTPVAPAITLSGSAMLDTRGVWTNAVLDPVHVAGEALVRGGTVAIDGAGAVFLGADTRIDVSSGGALLPGGRTLSGAGGSISVTADLDASGATPVIGTGAVAFDGAFVGYGSKGGGTLSLTAPGIVVGHGTAQPGSSTVVLAATLFQSGFSAYALDGVTDVEVLPGTQVDVAEPVYVAGLGLSVPTGGDPSRAYQVVLPPLFTPVRGGDTASQRGGASISLLSDVTPTNRIGGGSITIDAGARVAVDQGQSITLAGHGQVTVLGALVAPSGTIEVANTSYDSLSSSNPDQLQSGYVPGVSVWIGDGAILDASGEANLFTDPLGRRFGSVSAGGTIILGGYGGLSLADSTWAQVIVRPGALVEADGAAATVDVVAGDIRGGLVPGTQPVALASAGGAIVARSLSGVALDGTISARSGGAGAAGGSLSISLDPIFLPPFKDIPANLYQPSQILVTQDFRAVQAAGLAVGAVTPDATFGLGRISQAQVASGGFDQLSLSAADFVTFQGNVSLRAGRSITIAGTAIGTATGTEQVAIAAPVVTLTGYKGEFGTLYQPIVPQLNGAATTATLNVQADLLNLQDALYFGATVGLGSPNAPDGTSLPPVTATDTGFSLIRFGSTGDIRFLGESGTEQATLESAGNLLFQAAQLYPVSGQAAFVYAGLDPAAVAGGNALPGGTITVLGVRGAMATLPDSVGGQLALVAANVIQDGTVRAPQGQIRLGFGAADALNAGAAADTTFTTAVTLGAGSVTSVSLIGQTIPYGGTVDGVNYLYPSVGGSAVAPIESSLSVASQSLTVAAGASVDLRGGGTLSGAGFVVGRGGSADVLRTPLLNISGGAAVALGLAQTGAVSPTGSGDGVFAILPGRQPAYAPAQGVQDAGYSQPTPGQQITVGDTVPGLPPGTYTLLPAYYALLPGAYRVELTSTTLLAGSAVALGNFSTAAPVITRTANTAIAGMTPISAIFTDGPGIRQLSQYDEETYNAFLTATGTQFGAPRPFLPQDAKTLSITYPSTMGTLAALTFAPGALLQAPDAAAGGYGLTVEIQSAAPIDVLGAKDAPIAGDVSLRDTVLDGLATPRLILGGSIAILPTSPDTAVVTGSGPGISIDAGADLTAGDVLVATSAAGAIAVAGGARVAALGSLAPAYSLAQGFYFISGVADGATYPVLDVSNGQDVFLPTTQPVSGAAITIGDGATLLAGGSLSFIAPIGTSVGIGRAILGGKYVALQVGDINIGSLPPGSAATLPTGLDLSTATLATLLGGDPAQGVPAASQLALTATQEVNILGTVSLDTATTGLVLNTPAIYGYGSAADTASITAASFTWDGVATQVLANGAVVPESALPGGQITGSDTNVTASLLIKAATITLGAGPQTQADRQLSLDRLLAGFGSVTLEGTSDITASGPSTLGVYATQAQYGQPGTGGDLTLSSSLVTAESGALVKITAGGALALASPTTPSPTEAVATLGGEIDLVATSIVADTAIALPSGRLSLTAQDGIAIGDAAHIDLSGRDRTLFDQVAAPPGGSLVVESTAGGITEAPGAAIDVSAPTGAAGSASFSALTGVVALDGTISGGATGGAASGDFSVVAGALPGFDALNAALDQGGVFGSRSFEVATGDIAIDTTLRAHTVSVTADSGSIDITGRIDASGAKPGRIAIAAGKNLTLEAGAALDAHATQTALDSYGQPIDAENRAHVSLSAAAGLLSLAGGSIDVSYPGEGTRDTLHPNGNPQGQVDLYAPRIDAAGAVGTPASLTYGDVDLAVTGTPAIAGAASIALYANATYTTTDPLGKIGQDTSRFTPFGSSVILSNVDADSTAFIAGFDAPGSQQKLGGLVTYGAAFHVRPGVIIDSSAASNGNLTINGDLNLEGFRYAAGPDYGTAKTTRDGSGEPGSIVFRATNQLIVNGSVTDGFAAPPDSREVNFISADSGWVVQSRFQSPDPLDADVLLPSSITITTTVHGVTMVHHQIELAGTQDGGVGTTFDVSRAISLNYAIDIASATIDPNKAIPFVVTLGADSDPIPRGGWVATASVADSTGAVLYARGAVIPAGTVLAQGDTLGAGTVLPVGVTSQDNTPVPAGTLLDLFSGDPLGNHFITLFNDTGILPANALIPSNTGAVFVTPEDNFVTTLELRPTEKIFDAKERQGLTYALASLLPAGSQSWNLSFVAGADQASADTRAVLPKTVLAGGALAPAANTANQAPGSLILDDQHDFKASTSDFTVAPGVSVIRTGTGDLSLVAGGDFDQSSLFGIYTAGSQTSLGGQVLDKPYDLARTAQGSAPGDVLPGNSADVMKLNSFIAAGYQAYYPNGGGDVLVSAQGDMTGDVLGIANTSSTSAPPSDAVGSWLWRQGGSGLDQLGAWWINYGTVVESTGASGSFGLQLAAFQGIGALGGGNVSVVAGGNAGQTTFREGENTPGEARGEGLIVAVGGTGRVLADGGILLTGGGTETVQIGGQLNPLDSRNPRIQTEGDTLNGDFIDLRGDIAITAGAVGHVQSFYSSGASNVDDPRSLDPFAPDFNTNTGFVSADGGPIVVPGDGTVSITTLRDLVLAGAGDPGRVDEASFTSVTAKGLVGTKGNTGGDTGFSLWTASTGISLFSSGGDVTPTTQPLSNLALDGTLQINDSATDYRFVYPATLDVTAATGSIVYGTSPGATYESYGLETAPSPTGNVAFLAGTSIYANGFAIDMSGASTAGLSTPFDPAYTLTGTKHGGNFTLTDIRQGGGTNPSPLALFALEADTPTTDLHADDPAPALFYAAGGDIVNLVSGQTLTFPSAANEALQSWYLAAKPVRVMASGDIVSSGTRPAAGQGATQQNQAVLPQYLGGAIGTTASGDLFLNNSAQSVSVVSAGRDILSGYFYVGGPGLLEVDAGRNLFQAGYTLGTTQVLDFGSIKSLGSLLADAPVTLTGGADVAVLAGIGSGAAYGAFASLYLDPANQADLTLPITDPSNAGKVQLVYTAQLAAWLAANYPALDTSGGALAAFRTLPQVDQDIFDRKVFFDEVLAGGRQFNDPTSRFFGSYARGRQAIDTLFPSSGTEATPGVPAGYDGAITMLSGPVAGLSDAAGPLGFDAGVSTEFGGNIQVLDPGGQVVLGTAGGPAPGPGSGIITNGTGDVDIYALDSVLLGKSRVFTTAGGNILIWSSQGDINAGIGAKTTVVFTPPIITYDSTGGLSETPSVPTSGAGIATLAPLPDIPAGNVDLIAPLGTIDAGEAGIRVSGNLNIAAAAIANGANFSVGGKTSGNAAPASVSLGSVEAAGSAAGAAATAAQTTTSTRGPQDTPSVIEVEVTGVSGGLTEEEKRRRKGL